MTDQPNDKLLVDLLHIVGIAPLYRRRPGQSSLTLLTAKVYIDASCWPLSPDQNDAALQWAANKCSIRPDKVTLQALPGDGTSGIMPQDIEDAAARLAGGK
jgi:hypothetical protein